MKQKRTVKSLLPSKYKVGEKFFMVLLLTLSVMLCIGAATLMTTSVGAAEEETPSSNSNNIYSGYDDKVEVLYKMEFSNPENLYDENVEPVDNFYMEDNILYVSPSMVRVKDADNTGAHSFLGGKGNDVKSDNVTMLAGYKNIVNFGNDKASVLGGSGNKVVGNSSQVPVVIAGGRGNQILDNNKGNAILGGDKNKIQHSVDSVILGGESNEITGNNVIIGGKKVKILKNNIFAFSNENSEFRPESEKTFYLNLTNGVGINADSEKSGMAVGGAVGFGSVGGETCDGDNIGVEGILNLNGYGCLVGCTKASKNNSNKWELLDRGENCENACKSNSNICMSPSEDSLDENQNYTGYCSQNIPDGSIRCTTGEWESYTNVVFQTLKVESQSDCENVGDNKCACYCAEGDCEIPDVPEDCPSGFHVEDGECVSNMKKVPCNKNWKPDNSEYDESNKNYIILWIDGSRSEAPSCDWNCINGFVKSGNTCVLSTGYKCIGTPPEHAYFITGSDEGLGSDTQNQVIKYSDRDDDTKKCAYLCESGFVAVVKDFGGGNRGYVCDQCESGTQDPKNPDVCVRVEDCPDGYVRDSSMGTGCYLKGVCRYKDGSEYTGRSLGTIVGNYGDMEPISAQDFNFKCIDNDKYRGEVEPHTCTFECQEGSYCNGNAKCEVPKCRSYLYGQKDEIDGKNYYYRAGRPGHYDFVGGYSNMIFGTGVTTSGEFFQKYGNKTGCYYWCPLENRYYIANSVFLWRCGSLGTVEANQKKCEKIYLYGYGVSVKKPQVDKQAWQYTGNYQAVKDGALSCTWSCEPGSQPMFATRMTENTAKDIEQYGYPKRLFLTGSSGKICYKECKKDGKFMNDDGRCESCQAGYKLDENQLGTSVINGVTYQEYRGCTPDCPDGTVWQNNACMQKKIGGICPEGYVSEGGNCYKCLSNSQVYVQGKGCIDKV